MTERKNFKYYDLIMAAFVTVLLCSNLIGVGKAAKVFGITFGTGNLFFPISYIFGDILTEVYGYKYSRKVVWAGFGALIFASFMSFVVVKMPPAPEWRDQEAIEKIFGATPRIVFSSLIAYFAGEFANSFTLAKMKIWTKGKYLWSRTIGSTIVGEAVDSIIFYPLALYGTWEGALLGKVMLTAYLTKVIWEIIMTPFTYKIVNFLKKAEQEDYYDTHTKFTPFSLKT